MCNIVKKKKIKKLFWIAISNSVDFIQVPKTNEGYLKNCYSWKKCYKTWLLGHD